VRRRFETGLVSRPKSFVFHDPFITPSERWTCSWNEGWAGENRFREEASGKRKAIRFATAGSKPAS